MKKRVLSLFMALALCLSLVPGAALAEAAPAAPEQGAAADTADVPQPQEETPAAEPLPEPSVQTAGSIAPLEEGSHQHYWCGGATCSGVGGHGGDTNTDYSVKLWMDNGTLKMDDTELTTTTVTDVKNGVVGTYYALPKGSYYLDTDLTLDHPLYITEKLGSVNLCLNGKTITANGDFDAVVFYAATLTIFFRLSDCQGTGTITHAPGTSGRGMYLYSGQAGVCRFQMYGGTITGNTTAGEGGGVFVGGYSSELWMFGGAITNNTAGTNGGGVYVYNEPYNHFYLRAGSITGNTAVNGGGVHADSGEIQMCGGTISGNTAADCGGVYVGSTGRLDLFNLYDAIKIDGNTGGNVYLSVTRSITMRGALKEGSSIGVTTAKQPGPGDFAIVAEGSSGTSYAPTAADAACFSADAGSGYDLLSIGNAIVLKQAATTADSLHQHPVCGDAACTDHASELWMPLSADSIDLRTTKYGGVEYYTLAAGCYYLTDDLVLDKGFYFYSAVKLDLNGHSLIVNGAVDAIQVNSYIAFTLTDCNSSGAGRGIVTHGTTDGTTKYAGSGVHIRSSGIFNMYGGAISGNTTSNYGSGVYNDGTFTMYGGTIAKNRGGYGVYVTDNSSFVMNGGTITGNDGGVSLADMGSKFTMTGGRIVGNSSARDGGGVRQYNPWGTITITGDAQIKDNFKNGTLGEDGLYVQGENGVSSNVWLATAGGYGRVIAIGKAGLGADAVIGVTAALPKGASYVTVATGANNGCQSGNIISDNSAYDLQRAGDNVLLKAADTELHMHAVCGKADCTETGHSSVMWQPLTYDAAAQELKYGGTAVPSTVTRLSAGDVYFYYTIYQLPAGNYYLAEDIALTGGEVEYSGETVTSKGGLIQIGGSDKNVKLCLNGKTLSTPQDNLAAVNVGNKAALTLSDCKDGGAIKKTAANAYDVVQVYSAGTFTMYGGTLTGGVTGVRTMDTIFNMYGGTITGNETGVDAGEGDTITIGGTANITGNTEKNVSLRKGGVLNLDPSLARSARIGITSEVTLSEKTPTVKFASGAENTALDYSAIFTADQADKGYVVKKTDTDLYLALHQHAWTYTVSEDGKTISAACTADGCPSRDGGSVTIGASDGVYTGKEQPAEETDALTGGVTDPVTISYQVKDGGTFKDNMDVPKNAGTYKAVLSLGGKTASVEYTIAKAELTVTANASTITYGDVPVSNGVKYKGFVDGEDDSVLGGSLTYTYSYPRYGDTGLYIITPGGLTAANYEINTVPGTLTVEPREATLRWSNTDDRTVGDNKGPVIAEVSNAVNGDAVTVTVTGGDAATAGTHTATATGLTGAKAGNYKLPAAGLTKEYTVGAAAQNLTFEKQGGQTAVYGDAFVNAARNDRADGGKITYISSAPDVAEVDGNGAVTIKSVGTATITATAAAVDGQYSAGKASYQLTVTKREVTVTVDAVSRVYGDQNPAFTAAVTAGILAGSDTVASLGLTLTTAATTASNVGSYDVTGTAANTNYNVTVLGEKKLTVTKRPVTVTIAPVSRTYGDRNPVIDYDVTSGTLVNGDELGLRLTTAPTETSPVGTYDIDGTADNQNYAVTVEGAGKLTVTPKAITVTVNAVSRAYGEANPAFTAAAPSGALVGSDTVASLGLTLTTTANTTSNVGSYDVTGTAGNQNYTVTVDGADKLTVTPRAITVTADNKTTRIGQDLAALTYTYAPELVGSDAFTGALATTASKDRADTYPITQGTLALSNNYAITFNAGTYTVVAKQDQSGFRFDGGQSTLTKTYGDPDFTVAATGAAEGSKVTYTSSNEAVAKVDADGKVTIVSAGTATITAAASETKDYNEASISYDLTVEKKSVAIPAKDATAFTYNGQAQTYTLAENDAYTISGNVQTKANEAGYTVTVALKDTANTKWSDGTTDDKTYSFVIAKKSITAPAEDTAAFTYNGQAQTYTLTESDAYTISGNVQTDANEAGYTVTVALTDTANTKWADGTTADKTYSFVIAKKSIAVPAEDTTAFTYTGEAQTYTLAESDDYTISGNTQTDANEAGYTVTVALKDTANTKWSDGTTDNKTYTFIIKKAVITITVKDKRAYVGTDAPDLSKAAADEDYTVSGLIGTDTLGGTITLTYAADLDMTKIGTAAIKASGATASDNYTIQYVDGTLTIVKRPSSGGGAATPTYPVETPSKAENGSVSSDVKSAVSGSTVTITVKSDSGYTLDSLTVTDGKGNELKLTDKGNGKYTFTMPDSKVTVKTSFTQETETSPFGDVAEDAYYYEAVKWANDQNITGGTGNGRFSPDASCTRAQIVTFLWRLYAGK